MTADPARRGHQRPLYQEIADPGSMARFGEEIEAQDPSRWPGYEEQVQRAREAAGARHAVTTALASVAGQPCVLVGFEFRFLGGSIGVAEGARIVRAFSAAAAERLPIVCVAASGGSRMQEGTSALTQMQAIAAAIADTRRAGVPYIAVAGDPTTGGVWASLIAGADVIISMPGARVGFSGSRSRPAGADPESRAYLADGHWSHGFIDVLSPLSRLRSDVAAAIRLLSPRSRGEQAGPAPLPSWPQPTANVGQPGTSAWSLVTHARGGGQARAGQWLAAYFGHTTFEIRGDRCGGVDTGLRCGFGRHDRMTVAFVAQTGEQATPAGFRTATRLLELASRLQLPVLTLIDTPGAAATPADESAGVGAAIAELLVTVAASQVPITSVIIGEGVSGGALALASPDDLWIAWDGYLSVTAPEVAASILKLDGEDVPGLAERLRLTPADLMNRGIVRGIIGPPAASVG